MRVEEHGHPDQDLAAYALDALEESERGPVEEHLEACERCARELRWLRASVDLLPASVEQRRPPTRLRRRLLATVRAEAAEAARRGRGDRRLLPSFQPAAVLAAAAVGLIAGALGYAVLAETGPQAESFAVEATAEAPAPVDAELVRRGDSGELEVRGLPTLRGGDVYQVWVRDDEVIEPSSVFVLDREGAGVTAIPAGLEGADEVMVSREPRGGSRLPSTAPLLRASLQ